MDRLKRIVLNRLENRVSKEDVCLLFTGDIGSILLISLLEGMVKEVIVPCFKPAQQGINNQIRKILEALNYPDKKLREVVVDGKEADFTWALLEFTEKYMVKSEFRILVTSLDIKCYQSLNPARDTLSTLA